LFHRGRLAAARAELPAEEACREAPAAPYWAALDWRTMARREEHSGWAALKVSWVAGCLERSAARAVRCWLGTRAQQARALRCRSRNW
jgi:hypothetical protein